MWVAFLTVQLMNWAQTVGAVDVIAAQSSSPALLALVQTASTAPAVLFALLAGAAADLLDRRRLLAALTAAMALVMASLAAFVVAGEATPALVLLLTFALGVGVAMAVPAFASLIPDLVPREELAGAVTLNGVSINLARAVGPALAGAVVALSGAGLLFAAQAVILAALVVLLVATRAPIERAPAGGDSLGVAMRAGLGFARRSRELRAVLVRGGSFVLPASALWALLPSVAVDRLKMGSSGFGVLLAALGVGAVAGAQALPRLRAGLGLSRLVAAGSAYGALNLVVLTLVRSDALAVGTMVLAGAAWMAVLSSVQTAAQLAAPDWVRGRALAVNQLTFAGGMAAGSAAWGLVAAAAGLTTALLVAAALLAVVAAAGLRRPLGDPL